MFEPEKLKDLADAIPVAPPTSGPHQIVVHGPTAYKLGTCNDGAVVTVALDLGQSTEYVFALPIGIAAQFAQHLAETIMREVQRAQARRPGLILPGAAPIVPARPLPGLGGPMIHGNGRPNGRGH